MAKRLLMLISLFYCNYALSQDYSNRHNLFELNTFDKNTWHTGIEYAELMQNHFNNLGKDNFTFFIGQQLGQLSNGKFGWRYMIINAELSDEHIQNENQVAFIGGNRLDLTGNVHAQRICFDYYPVSVGIGYLKNLNRHVFKINPVVYADLGYNRWGFTNTLYNEDYLLKALTAGGGFRLQSVLFGILIIENPLMDFFTYVIKNRDVKGDIGDTQITRPEHFGIFGWATIGLQFKLKKGN